MDADEDLKNTLDRLEKDVNQISEIVTDTIMRVAALERILFKENIISETKYEEIVASMQQEMVSAIRAEAAKKIKEEVSS